MRAKVSKVGLLVAAVVEYRDVTFATADGRGIHARAPELRIGLDEATRSLEALERLVPRHDRWVVAALFGLAASAIAWLLRADWGA